MLKGKINVCIAACRPTSNYQNIYELEKNGLLEAHF